MKKEVCLLFICVIMINITPACAVNIGEMNNELQNLSNSKDVQSIDQWQNGNGWYRFWHFGGFCSAVYHLSSQSDSLSKDAQQLNHTLNLTSDLKGFLEHQVKLNTELSGYLNQTNKGESPVSPSTAVMEANILKQEFTEINKTIDISVNQNVKEPQKYDVVQLIGEVSNSKGDYTLHYWFLKDFFTDNDTGESMITLYNGNSYVTMTYKNFKKKYTGIVLRVNDIKQLNINNNDVNLISSDSNQTANPQSTVSSSTNQNSTGTNSSDNTVANQTADTANQTAATTNQIANLASTEKANSAALCDIVDTIYSIKSNDLSKILSSIPEYDDKLAKLLTIISCILNVVGIILWVVGGLIFGIPAFQALGLALSIFGGILCGVSVLMLIYVACMKDTRDDSNRLSDIIYNVKSHSIS